MAEDKKPQNLDDWDNMPLDPDADDWDDIPPPPPERAPRASTSTPLEKVSPPSPAPPAKAAEPAEAVAPDTSDGEDDFDAPEPLSDDDFDAPDTAAATSDFAPPPAATEPAPTPEAAPEDEEDDGFEVVSTAAAEEAPPVEVEEIPMPNASAPQPPSKKVELDIEGMNFKEDEEPEDDDDEAADEPPKAAAHQEAKAAAKSAAPEEAAPAPEAVAPRVKKSKKKLLIIIVPALLGLFGLIFLGYSLLFAPPDPSELPPPPPPPISTELPAREPSPGELRLESFYISFPGRTADTVIELSIVLHYNDSTDEMLIHENISALRDIIYRVTQGKGSLVITDNELQRVLREELRERLNALWGADRISYVQINQIRILQ